MTLLYVLAGLLVLVGMAGIVLPALPGIPLVFAGLLLAAWVDGFRHIGVPTLVVLGLLTLLSLAIDFWATAVGARRVGASRLAVLGAVIGALAGLWFGPIGLFVGPFLGVIVWNAVVYLALVTAWLRRRGPTEPRAPWSSRTLMRSVAQRSISGISSSEWMTACGSPMGHPAPRAGWSC